MKKSVCQDYLKVYLLKIFIDPVFTRYNTESVEWNNPEIFICNIFRFRKLIFDQYDYCTF